MLGRRLLEIVHQLDKLPVQPFVSHLQTVCLILHLLTQGVVAFPDVALQVLQPFEDIVGRRNLLVLLCHLLLLVLLPENSLEDILLFRFLRVCRGGGSPHCGFLLLGDFLYLLFQQAVRPRQVAQHATQTQCLQILLCQDGLGCFYAPYLCRVLTQFTHLVQFLLCGKAFLLI